ncbi:D-alanine--D-alanine ligase [Leptospira sp. WS39.C2]
MKTVVIACDVYDHNKPKHSQEWESEETIVYMEKTIQSLGYDVVVLSDAKEITSVLSGIPKKNRENWIVWNLIEGYFSSSREAYIPALCEYLGIPHTGSAASVQTLTLDKYKTKLYLRSFGIPISDSTLITNKSDLPDFPFPVFVKPNGEGSSLGISDLNVIHNKNDWNEIVPNLLEEYSPLLVEPYLTGKELTVGVIGNFNQYQVLPVAFVETPSGVYHEGIKSKSEFLESLNFFVPPSLYEELTQVSLKIAEVLEVSGYLRIDFKLENEKPYFLEANATPGFSHIYSTLPMLWEKFGKSYKELLQICLELGFLEYKNHKRFQYGKDQC